jgi:hypothetical protein
VVLLTATPGDGLESVLNAHGPFAWVLLLQHECCLAAAKKFPLYQ